MISEARVEASNRTILVPRHIALVRVTHWIIGLSVGPAGERIGILVGHPRCLGETGQSRTGPSLIFPFVDHRSLGWYRPYHFFFAWILVLTGLT